ncbi:hypothetical protein BCR36DRAFT_327461 [Piromyces finnis]|uniref:Dynein assembly factor 3, axonemal n=1 Tax=Piromyces finnis TaxID=1754191 RepID=A0A1Y1V9Y8_9FUNG|nr:hypothetical protein BCR36DRAFT_327461 [Piromyces finnis]|eukprot:ORX50011.1 hypothetical protein BCR36DRAFT_327461 [Piromyces finnis]
MEGTGKINIWGFSPAVDLQDTASSECEKNLNDIQINVDKDNKDDLNMLLVAPADPRHIIKTMARAWRYNNKFLNFYLMETQTSVLARDIILLSIILDWSENIGIQERVELFLEIYGNICVREKTEKFIKERAYDLIRTITDSDETKSKLSKIIDVSNLKFRERDDLEFVFKFWRSPKKNYEIQKYWDYRLRAFYKRRFDYIENVCDWDYQMKLNPRADMINLKEFTKWRRTGQAFEVRETLYDRPNKVTATVEGMKEDGLTVSKWGYFSDIIVGPFIAFGCDSENKEYLKTQNDFHIKTSQDVSEYNLRSFIYELNEKKLYFEDKKIVEINDEGEKTESNNFKEKGKNKDEDNTANSQKAEQDNKINEDNKDTEATTSVITENKDESIPNDTDKNRKLYPDVLDHSKLYLLPCEPSYTFARKLSKFKQKFDKIYISNSMVHRLKEYSTLLKPDGEMIVEMAKFMIELKDELLPEYDKKVMGMANEAGLVIKKGIKIPEIKKGKNTVKKSEEVYKRSHLVFVFKSNN